MGLWNSVLVMAGALTIWPIASYIVWPCASYVVGKAQNYLGRTGAQAVHWWQWLERNGTA